MKVAISLPGTLFNAAELYAAHVGKSRSQLYSEALARFLEINQGSVITAQLNAVYSSGASKLDAEVSAAQLQALANGAW